VKDSYNRAIRRAVDRANEERLKGAQAAGINKEEVVRVPRWHSNQLRHTAATKLRALFGLEAARTVLGHADPKITLTYAEADFAKAAQAMKQVG
jgi:integrase